MLRRQVLSLYRDFLRLVRQAPAADQISLKLWIRGDFENNRYLTDEYKIIMSNEKSTKDLSNSERMDSIGADCTPLKHEYDDCFNKWYADEFLSGKWKGKDGHQPCQELFTKYRACVLKTMKEKNIEIDEVLKRIIGTSDELKPPVDTIPET